MQYFKARFLEQRTVSSEGLLERYTREVSKIEYTNVATWAWTETRSLNSTHISIANLKRFIVTVYFKIITHFQKCLLIENPSSIQMRVEFDYVDRGMIFSVEIAKKIFG